MPDHTEQAVSELTSLLRMLQVFPETGSIGKIYMLLLAFCTTWRTFGFQRAYLLLVEPAQNAVKGHVAAERAPVPPDGDDPSGPGASFEAMAKTDLRPHYLAARPGDIVESLADISQADSQLAFKPRVSFENGLQRTFEWYSRQKRGR